MKESADRNDWRCSDVIRSRSDECPVTYLLSGLKWIQLLNPPLIASHRAIPSLLGLSNIIWEQSASKKTLETDLSLPATYEMVVKTWKPANKRQNKFS